MSFILDDNPDDPKDLYSFDVAPTTIYSVSFSNVKVVPVYQTPGDLGTERMEYPSPCGTYILVVDKPKFSTMNDTNDFHSGWY